LNHVKYRLEGLELLLAELHWQQIGQWRMYHLNEPNCISGSAAIEFEVEKKAKGEVDQVVGSEMIEKGMEAEKKMERQKLSLIEEEEDDMEKTQAKETHKKEEKTEEEEIMQTEEKTKKEAEKDEHKQKHEMMVHTKELGRRQETEATKEEQHDEREKQQTKAMEKSDQMVTEAKREDTDKDKKSKIEEAKRSTKTPFMMKAMKKATKAMKSMSMTRAQEATRVEGTQEKEKEKDKEKERETGGADERYEAEQGGAVKAALMKVLETEKQKRKEMKKEKFEELNADTSGMSHDNKLLLKAFKEYTG